jgi:hypothetical protein
MPVIENPCLFDFNPFTPKTKPLIIDTKAIVNTRIKIDPGTEFIPYQIRNHGNATLVIPNIIEKTA